MELHDDWATQRSCLKGYTNVSQIQETFLQPKQHQKYYIKMELPKGLTIQRSCFKSYTNVSWIQETFVQSKHPQKN
jgi:hypothetical protein